jgi:hypothetical protein
MDRWTNRQTDGYSNGRIKRDTEKWTSRQVRRETAKILKIAGKNFLF